MGFGKVHLESKVSKSIKNELGGSDGCVIGSGNYQPVIDVRKYGDTLKTEIGGNRCHAIGRSSGPIYPRVSLPEVGELERGAAAQSGRDRTAGRKTVFVRRGGDGMTGNATGHRSRARRRRGWRRRSTKGRRHRARRACWAGGGAALAASPSTWWPGSPACSAPRPSPHPGTLVPNRAALPKAEPSGTSLCLQAQRAGTREDLLPSPPAAQTPKSRPGLSRTTGGGPSSFPPDRRSPSRSGTRQPPAVLRSGGGGEGPSRLAPGAADLAGGAFVQQCLRTRLSVPATGRRPLAPAPSRHTVWPLFLTRSSPDPKNRKAKTGRRSRSRIFLFKKKREQTAEVGSPSPALSLPRFPRSPIPARGVSRVLYSGSFPRFIRRSPPSKNPPPALGSDPRFRCEEVPGRRRRGPTIIIIIARTTTPEGRVTGEKVVELKTGSSLGQRISSERFRASLPGRHRAAPLSSLVSHEEARRPGPAAPLAILPAPPREGRREPTRSTEQTRRAPIAPSRARVPPARPRFFRHSFARGRT
uniref:Basic proline-rich protein-like n=1 Tax=Pogona vitticeps TaxID=103695 RepID=A0ABM5FCN8_9SAUR